VTTAKLFADLITFSRAFLWLLLGWIGLAYGRNGLPLAALVLMYSWTSDVLDGPIARRSKPLIHTWIGDHDLEVDMSVAAGVLIYLTAAGYTPLLLSIAYCLLWSLFFLRYGLERSPGMLFQAPIYAWFLWVACQDAPGYGITLWAWILAVVVATWPQFPRQVIPDFLRGFRSVFHSSRQK
jgi:phosphatidylglycerophosphate synthase